MNIKSTLLSLLSVSLLIPVSQVAACQTATAEPPAKQELAEEKEDKQEKKERKKRKKSEMEDFLRIKKDAKGRPVAMQTSVTRYIAKTPDGKRISVDLIGVVHVGEKSYYEKFNDLFKRYDGMLYELVAPEGTVIPKGGRSGGAGFNPVAALQMQMKTQLELEFQLEHVDYTKDNFIHADMTPTEFAQSMKDNNESVTRIMLKAVGQSIRMSSSNQSSGADVRMITALFSRNKALRLRRIAAEQMSEMEGSMAMFNGDEGSTIIDRRNAKCMDILKREIESGKSNLAIFYGAGHLPDMQRRLESDFKMKRAGQFWLDAWKLTKRGEKKADKAADKAAPKK